MRWRADSLRGRLVIGLVWAILGIWLIGVFVQYRLLAREQTGIWDASLRQIGRQILLSLPAVDLPAGVAPARLALPPSSGATPTSPHVEARPADFVYQFWREDGRLILSSVGAPPEPLAPLDFRRDEGFENAVHAGETWRVYSVTDASGTVQLQLAKAERAYAALAASWLTNSLMVTIGLIAILATLAWWIVSRTLAPAARLGAALQQRAPLDLRPVDTGPLPRELRPMIVSFNGLLSRHDAALAGERRFIADAAHELRTPLAALKAQAQAVARADSLARCRAELRPLVEGIERASRLSEQMLDLAHVDALGEQGLSPQPIHELVALVVHDYAAAARDRGQRLLLRAEPFDAPVAVDALGVLVRNLVDNAIRYAGPGATIEILCEGGAAGPARLVVRDDGPGVPAAERERIFDRFYRVAGVAERGSGIGLSLVARIAQLHQGRARAGAGPAGRGLVVTVEWPLPAVHTDGPRVPERGRPWFARDVDPGRGATTDMG